MIALRVQSALTLSAGQDERHYYSLSVLTAIFQVNLG